MVERKRARVLWILSILLSAIIFAIDKTLSFVFLFCCSLFINENY